VAQAMDERQPAGLVVRVEYLDEVEQLVRGHARTDLDAQRVGDAAEELDVSAREVTCPVADPGEVRAEVIPALAAWYAARLGLLVVEMQPLMAGEELDAADLVQPPAAHGLEEPQRLADVVDHPLVVAVGGRRPGKVEVPPFRMVQIGKSAAHQGADEVE